MRGGELGPELARSAIDGPAVQGKAVGCAVVLSLQGERGRGRGLG